MTDDVTVSVRPGLSWAGVYTLTCVACRTDSGGWTLATQTRPSGRDATLTCEACHHRQRHALVYPEFVTALAAALDGDPVTSEHTVDGRRHVIVGEADDAISQWIPHRRCEGIGDPLSPGASGAVYWRAWGDPADADWWRESWQELIDVSDAIQTARNAHPDSDETTLVEAARRNYRELSKHRTIPNIEVQSYEAFAKLAESHRRELPTITATLAELATDNDLPVDVSSAVRDAHLAASHGDARTAHGHLASLGIERVLHDPELDQIGRVAAQLGMMFPR